MLVGVVGIEPRTRDHQHRQQLAKAEVASLHFLERHDRVSRHLLAARKHATLVGELRQPGRVDQEGVSQRALECRAVVLGLIPLGRLGELSCNTLPLLLPVHLPNTTIPSIRSRLRFWIVVGVRARLGRGIQDQGEKALRYSRTAIFAAASLAKFCSQRVQAASNVAFSMASIHVGTPVSNFLSCSLGSFGASPAARAARFSRSRFASSRAIISAYASTSCAAALPCGAPASRGGDVGDIWTTLLFLLSNPS